MIAIIMSTYNGEEYIKAQLDSILCQSYSDFVLYIRDDGSTDQTVSLITSYTDPRIKFSSGENLGPAGSFFSLLNQVSNMDYIFFSDQDDVWDSDKLERMLAVMQRVENGPTMVFSDFRMIDQNDTLMGESFAAHAHLRVCPGIIGVEKILAQPYVFGCASVINRDLAQAVLQPPRGIEMHDCWISLTASCIGTLYYMPEATISHRFHNRNATGRKGQSDLIMRLKRITKGFHAQVENTLLRLHQVTLLLNCYGDAILPEKRILLEKLSCAMNKGRLATISALRRYGIARQKYGQTLFFYFTVLGIKGDIR